MRGEKKGNHALWTMAADSKKEGQLKVSKRMSHDETISTKGKKKKDRQQEKEVQTDLQALKDYKEGILIIAIETYYNYQKKYYMTARFQSRFWHNAVCQFSRCTQIPTVSVKIWILAPSVLNKKSSVSLHRSTTSKRKTIKRLFPLLQKNHHDQKKIAAWQFYQDDYINKCSNLYNMDLAAKAISGKPGKWLTIVTFYSVA